MSEGTLYVSRERFEDCQQNERDARRAFEKRLDKLDAGLLDIREALARYKGSLIVIATIASLLGSAVAAAAVNYVFQQEGQHEVARKSDNSAYLPGRK